MTLEDVLKKYKDKEIRITRTQNLFVALDDAYSGYTNYNFDIYNVSFDSPLINKPDCSLHLSASEPPKKLVKDELALRLSLNIQITNNIYSVIRYYIDFGDNFFNSITLSKNPIKFSLNIIEDDYKRLINAIDYLIAETNNRINNIKRKECINLFDLYVKDSMYLTDQAEIYRQMFEKYINSFSTKNEDSLNIYDMYDFLKNMSKKKADKEILLHFLEFLIFGNISDAIEIKFSLIYGIRNFPLSFIQPV